MVEEERSYSDEAHEPSVRMSERVRSLPQRLKDIDITFDNKIDENGELVHFALLVEFGH